MNNGYETPLTVNTFSKYLWVVDSYVELMFVIHSALKPDNKETLAFAYSSPGHAFGIGCLPALRHFVRRHRRPSAIIPFMAVKNKHEHLFVSLYYLLKPLFLKSKPQVVSQKP